MKSETETIEKKCLFVIKTKESPFKAIHDRIKQLNGFYNSVGWFIENKHKGAVSHICETANLRCIDFPLSESFENFRRQHNLSYFAEKS